jgi:hypothetical protein
MFSSCVGRFFWTFMLAFFWWDLFSCNTTTLLRREPPLFFVVLVERRNTHLFVAGKYLEVNRLHCFREKSIDHSLSYGPNTAAL